MSQVPPPRTNYPAHTRRNQGFAIFDYSAVGTIQHHHLDRAQVEASR